MRYRLMWGLAVVVLVALNGLILQKEWLLAESQPIYLELAPVDPRSLMQGDYMVLRYAIAQSVWEQKTDLPRRGQLVLTIDDKNIAQFERLYQAGEPLANNELLLNYHTNNRRVWLGAESFFFQEGHADYYEPAKYGELRVASSGESVLVGLRGEALESLGPPADKE